MWENEDLRTGNETDHTNGQDHTGVPVNTDRTETESRSEVTAPSTQNPYRPLDQQTSYTRPAETNQQTSYTRPAETNQQTSYTQPAETNQQTSCAQPAGTNQQTSYTQPAGAGQQTGFNGSADGRQSNYGQQNAWENPYTSRYHQAYGTSQYQNRGYQYSNTQFNSDYVHPADKPKKSGAGKVIAIVAAALAVMALVTFGLYQVAQRIPLSGGAAQQKVEQQEPVDQPKGEIAEAPAESDEQTENKAPAKEQQAQELPAGKSEDGSGQRVATISAPSPVVVTDVTQVVASSMPAIVSIDNNFTTTINYFGQRLTQEETGSGSGIIVGQNDEALLIATNYHVIEGAESLTVQFMDGERADAQVRDTDPDMDLAVISVPIKGVKKDTMSKIVIATLGDSDSLVLGEPAIAIGNALGQGQSVTVGVISAVNREIALSDGSTGTFIQTDAAINPGNSGGALLNSSGEVIGINSNKFADTDVEGMGFAIPISVAQPIIDEMMNREIVTDEERGYLGITGTTVPYEYTGIEGVRVRGVTGGTGAEAAGIQEDDIIIRLNGETIKSMESLQGKLKYCKAGDKVTLTILRRQNDRYVEVDVDVTLSDAEALGINNSQNEQEDAAGDQTDDPYSNGQNGQNGQDYGYYFGNGDDGYGYSFPFFPFFGGGNY